MQVSQSYIEGIKEGRSHLKLLEAPTPDDIRRAANVDLKFCEDIKFWQGSVLHADFCNGLRDFWLNQLKGI